MLQVFRESVKKGVLEGEVETTLGAVRGAFVRALKWLVPVRREICRRKSKGKGREMRSD